MIDKKITESLVRMKIYLPFIHAIKDCETNYSYNNIIMFITWTQMNNRYVTYVGYGRPAFRPIHFRPTSFRQKIFVQS